MTEGHVKMRTLKGIPASGGVAIGKGFFLNRVLSRSVRSTVGRDQVDAYAARIAKLDGPIHSVVTLDLDRARARARCCRP